MSTNRLRYYNTYTLVAAHVLTAQTTYYIYMCMCVIFFAHFLTLYVHTHPPTYSYLCALVHAHVNHSSLKGGFRAIDIARLNGHKEVVEVLLQSGAQVHVQYIDMCIQK